MELLLLPLGAWASIAAHELAHLVAFRLVGVPVLAVGTGWPPLLGKVNVGGVVVYAGARDFLSGLTIPARAAALPRERAFVSLAGPAANLLLVAGLIIVLLAGGSRPGTFVPLVLVACWNVFMFLTSAVPSHERGGNDGAHVQTHLGRAATPPDLAHVLALADLYQALGLRDATRDLRVYTGLLVAAIGLPEAAGQQLAALDALDGDRTGDTRDLLRHWIAVAADRWDDALAGFEALLAAPAAGGEHAWIPVLARVGLAHAHGHLGEPGIPHPALVAAPEAERPTLDAYVDLLHACRLGELDRAHAAAAAIGPLSWAGRLRLLDAARAAGDLARAREHAVAAAAAARIHLARLPPALHAEALASLAPLRKSIHTLAAALGEPDLPDMLLAPATGGARSGLWFLVATATGFSLIGGAMLIARAGSGAPLLQALAVPLATLLAARLLLRHRALLDDRPSPGAPLALAGAALLLGGGWWFAVAGP